LLAKHSNMLSRGWHVITRAQPECWHFNRGTTYLNVPRAAVLHLLCRMINYLLWPPCIADPDIIYLAWFLLLSSSNIDTTAKQVAMVWVCAVKRRLIGWRNVWNMRWRAPYQEVEERGHRKRLCKKIAKHVIWTRRMLWIVVDGRSWWRLDDDQDGWWVSVSSGTGSPG